jgi:septal ring factor EnvC (AmiA/AmiB activator)
MNTVSKLICIVGFFCAWIQPAIAQKNSEKLRKEQERLEKSINVTKSLLTKAKSNTQATLSELRVLENQLAYREDLLNNFESQIRSTELQIDEKSQKIETLQIQLKQLVVQYKELLMYAYKHRHKEGKWMYIFSSKSYHEALKRKKYLEKIAALQQKQKRFILQHQRLIHHEKITLEKEKEYKLVIVEQKKQEKENILQDKQEQETNYKKLKSEENKLSAEIQLIENKKIILKQRIKEAINAELLAEESRKKAREKKAVTDVRTTNSNKTITNKTNVTSVKESSSTSTIETTTKKVATISETKEVTLNLSFESNKGRLPWPVEKGTITEGYGKHAHPRIPNLYTNNNGVDITTHKNANIRAVFEGEVTSVLSIPGAGKVIIIKHGNYRTVYSNLKEVYVSSGSKVSTKQSIGALLPSEGEALSVAHFEIHHVASGQINRINPSLWITR